MYAKKRKLVTRLFSEVSGLCNIFGEFMCHLDFSVFCIKSSLTSKLLIPIFNKSAHAKITATIEKAMGTPHTCKGMHPIQL